MRSGATVILYTYNDWLEVKTKKERKEEEIKKEVAELKRIICVVSSVIVVQAPTNISL
jgi:nicotinamide riboside transporter PnuC